MATKDSGRQRRTDALSKQLIVRAAIEILDAGGEAALTFSVLTRRLNTGYGAIYHYVANKSDLLAAATDDVITRVAAGPVTDPKPREGLRALALSLFDAIDAHPWVGAQLTREPWRPTLLDVYKSIGEQLQALGVPTEAIFDSAGALMNYILGVAGQNAANARMLASNQTERDALLADIAAQWAQLDPVRHPWAHSTAKRLREHDDRAQFLVGVDLILAGIEAVNREREGS
ncbi:helix-turn-helix domain containing protein [Streptomyces sp. Qhu-G9]|uniref:TetR/AcrR family transcriptional regulator n=1 Tax=Streptomyces sp. Qhu-G9 TaxID=3452799 RepID=UPI0022AC67CF|nr:helix-turn-helix domain-containing protein [Streptomyces aurantiacus]WAU81965.1 helix-turn-helix domain containing protein [Streptomyces aurantiacus]